MNKSRSASEQLIFNFLLSFMAVWFIFQYFGLARRIVGVVAQRFRFGFDSLLSERDFAAHAADVFLLPDVFPLYLSSD